MSYSLKGKTVLITGSTDGLGKKLALEIAKHESNVIIHGRSIDKGQKVLAEINEIAPKQNHSLIICDFNKPETVSSAFSGIDKLDVLINNAGIWAEGETTGTSTVRIIELVNVNLSSYLLCSRTLLPILVKSEFGQILNVVSVAGIEIPTEYYHTFYSASKWGLQGFTEALAKEYDNKNLRVMGFYPGGMETELFNKAGLDYKQKEPWMFDPQESVEAILFMLTRNKKVNIKRLDLINHLQS